MDVSFQEYCEAGNNPVAVLPLNIFYLDCSSSKPNMRKKMVKGTTGIGGASWFAKLCIKIVN